VETSNAAIQVPELLAEAEGARVAPLLDSQVETAAGVRDDLAAHKRSRGVANVDVPVTIGGGDIVALAREGE
jgi:hypothetical protein